MHIKSTSTWSALILLAYLLTFCFSSVFLLIQMLSLWVCVQSSPVTQIPHVEARRGPELQLRASQQSHQRGHLPEQPVNTWTQVQWNMYLYLHFSSRFFALSVWDHSLPSGHIQPVHFQIWITIYNKNRNACEDRCLNQAGLPTRREQSIGVGVVLLPPSVQIGSRWAISVDSFLTKYCPTSLHSLCKLVHITARFLLC